MPRRPKFQPGKVVATPTALDRYGSAQVFECAIRHVCGDWGDTCHSDALLNDAALELGNRLLSVYDYVTDLVTGEHGTLWVITEADRSITTVLLPEEY